MESLMGMAAPTADLTFSAPLPLAQAVAFGHDDKQHDGREIYRLLTGWHPADADIESGHDFDRHVIASIVAVSAMERGRLSDRVGLSPTDLIALVAQLFPAAAFDGSWLLQASTSASPEDDEIAMVRDLLLSHRSTEGDVGRWLAAMVARRALEPNHLWEDLGLRERSELSRLLMHHFRPLAGRNRNNMRWKRFFYRMLCEDDGFVMCTTPVCTQCNDFELCFGDESGESRMADRRRQVALQEAGAALSPSGEAVAC